VIDALLSRLGFSTPPPATVEGFVALHRAYLERVPYEDLAVQLGETGPLDETLLAARLLADGRGGYCFELNTVLAMLLRGVGFSVEHHHAVVGGAGPTNHMALIATVEDELWLADAGLGEGFLEPLPFREGSYDIGPFTYTLALEPEGTWWMGQHAWGSFNGFRMQPAPCAVADFEPHHRRLATDPDSSFVKTLVVQKPLADRIVTLRARTLSSVGPSVDTKHVVADLDEFAATLRDVFGITVSGNRLERLWIHAVAQHESFVAASTS
jgi:N-hydroxyarylamine O-acetyltransferase